MAVTLNCVYCGREFEARDTRSCRCPECKAKYRKEYQQRYYQENVADYVNSAVESEKRRKAKSDNATGLTLAQVAGEARKLGLTYGKYMALLQSGGLDEYIRNRRRENAPDNR